MSSTKKNPYSVLSFCTFTVRTATVNGTNVDTTAMWNIIVDR